MGNSKWTEKTESANPKTLKFTTVFNISSKALTDYRKTVFLAPRHAQSPTTNPNSSRALHSARATDLPQSTSCHSTNTPCHLKMQKGHLELQLPEAQY